MSMPDARACCVVQVVVCYLIVTMSDGVDVWRELNSICKAKIVDVLAREELIHN